MDWVPWGAPDSPQAKVGDSCSALGTCWGPGCVLAVCSNTWEGLEPGASPGLIWAILERKVAGTLGTVLCCWEKAEGRIVGGSAPHAHQAGHCPGTSSQIPMRGWGRGMCSPMPPSASTVPASQERGPCKQDVSHLCLGFYPGEEAQTTPAIPNHPAPSSPPFLSSPQQSVTSRAHLHPFPSSQKAILNPGGC